MHKTTTTDKSDKWVGVLTKYIWRYEIKLNNIVRNKGILQYSPTLWNLQGIYY